MVEKLEVIRTVSVKELIRKATWDAKRGFDENRLKEVRECCLASIYPWSDEDFKWLAAKIKAYLGISDYPTIVLLIRRITLFRPRRDGKELLWPEKHVETVDLLTKVLEGLLSEPFVRDFLPQLKEVVVILCGRLKDAPELYNDRVRKIFQRLCERYTEKKNTENQTVVPIYQAFDTKFKEDYERLLQRVLRMMVCLKDKEFLPVLYRLGEEQGRNSKNFCFDLSKEEEMTLEFSRLEIIRYLENN